MWSPSSEKNQSSRAIDVAHLIGSLSVGGAERNLFYLAPYMAKSRFRYAILCLMRRGEFASEVEKMGITVVEFGYRRRNTVTTTLRLARFLRKNKVKILHTHLFLPGLIGRIAAWLAGTPVIITHEEGRTLWKKWYHKLFERVAIFKTDLRLAVSQDIAELRIKEEGTPPAKIRILPSGGVEPKIFDVPESVSAGKRSQLGLANQIVVGTIGRLVEAKGLDLLLEAASILKRLDSRVKFVIVGDGPLEEDLRRQIKAKNLDGIVHLLGKRTDIPEILSVIDVYVITSRTEGTPVSLIEAMMAAKPVAATAVGGIPEIISDGVDGILVTPEDAQEIANAILRLIKDADLRRRLGDQARKKAIERYSTKTVIEQTEAIYAELLRQKGL